MALTNGPNTGALTFGLPGEAHYLNLMNQWRWLDFFMNPNVISRAVTTPPGSPANGDAYIIPASATGAWAGRTNQLARWTTDLTTPAWEFMTPKNGWAKIFDKATFRYCFFNGTAWIADLRATLVFRNSTLPYQSIPTATATNVIFNTVLDNELGAYSAGAPTRLTVPAGVHRVVIKTSFGFSNFSTLGDRVGYLAKNGAGFAGRPVLRIPSPTDLSYINLASSTLSVTPGDYFEVTCAQTSGGPLEISGDPTGGASWFEMIAID